MPPWAAAALLATVIMLAVALALFFGAAVWALVAGSRG